MKSLIKVADYEPSIEKELVAPLRSHACFLFPPAWAFVLIALILAFAAPASAQPPTPSSTTWIPIGPAPLGVVAGGNVNSNVSGRIAGAAADPIDPNIIYIAAAGGGVWKTTNGGTSWAPLTDTQATLSMGAIAVSPSNPDVIYAGTGEANNSGDSNYGRGILKSVDGGLTWTLTTAGGAFDRLTTSRIAIDPTDPNTVYLAMSDFGNNGLCCAHTGIWKTVNGGATWTNTTAATLTQRAPYSDVVIDPNNPSILYGAIGNPFFNSIDQASNGVYQSMNGGGTWSLLSNAPHGTTTGRFAIGISKANSMVVYVSVSNPNTYAVLSVVRSDNGGSTFTTLTTPNFMGGQGWYDTAIGVDPSNAAIVYLAGAAGTNSILRSANSGGSWTDIRMGGAPNFVTPHVDHHSLGFDATGKLLDGDDGGIYRLDVSAPAAWSDLNGNLGTIQFEGIGLHPTDPNIAIAGSQDNGTELYTGNIVWQETDGGDGGFAKFSQTNGNRVYHIAPVGSFGPTNFFRRSDNGGVTWASKTNGFVFTGTFLFYPPFVVDPGNGDRLLTGGDRVYESTNGADLWTPISTPGSGGWPTGISVNAIGLAPSDVGTIYAATGLNNVFVTTDHGGTWTGHPIPGAIHVQDLQVDSANSQIVYAVINDFASGKVFRSMNGGTSWSNVTGNLPDEPFWSLQIDPLAPNTYYGGGDDGVYRTTNGGSSWSRFGMGFPNVQVYEIALNPFTQILAAATHGRGAWEILIPPPTTTVTVTNVTSSTPNGTYGTGATISIQVTFSDTVNVTGTPLLALNSGGTASYSSGSGTNTLTFSYTVAAGQNSADLDYTSTSALTLNGGTINDTIGNPANLALPAPGGPGSLGFNKDIVIDTTAPTTVTNVTSSTPNGSYGAGAVISIQVTFSGTVNVTGTPHLALNSGGTASYSSGSGTNTLTFSYTVAAGQNSADLDYTSTSALTLDGGTINNTIGNPANLTLPAPGGPGSLGFNKNIVIDTTAPTAVTFKVLFGSRNFNLIGSTRTRLPWRISGIQVVFSEPIASGNVNSLTGLSTTGFSGLGTNTLTWTITPVSIGAFTTSLLGTGGNALQDAAGNPIATFNENFKVLLGDVNDDGIVQSADLVLVNNARSAPYNMFDDANGDGVVDLADLAILRQQMGTMQP